MLKKTPNLPKDQTMPEAISHVINRTMKALVDNRRRFTGFRSGCPKPEQPKTMKRLQVTLPTKGAVGVSGWR